MSNQQSATSLAVPRIKPRHQEMKESGVRLLPPMTLKSSDEKFREMIQKGSWEIVIALLLCKQVFYLLWIGPFWRKLRLKHLVRCKYWQNRLECLLKLRDHLKFLLHLYIWMNEQLHNLRKDEKFRILIGKFTAFTQQTIFLIKFGF